jgi:hypothetical protein
MACNRIARAPDRRQRRHPHTSQGDGLVGPALRFHLHVTPTSASWLNLVERWCAALTARRIRRGSFYSVDDLVAVITECLDAHNHAPRPFTWSDGLRRRAADFDYRCEANT